MTPEKQGIMMSYIIFAVLWYVTHAIGMRKLFQKANVNPAIAFVPLWREVVLFQLVWNKKNMGLYWLILFVVGHAMYYFGAKALIQPVAWIGLVIIFAALYLWLRKCYMESHAFNMSSGTTVGLIFFNMIFTLCLGFNNNAEYKGAYIKEE